MFQLSELKTKILLTQIQTEISEKKQYLQSCLENLLKIMSQLDGKEETSVTLKLHLLNDPSRFLISRLLDPHCLGYDWPFGGLIWSFSIIRSYNKEKVNFDNIFIEDAVLYGAEWNDQKLCMVPGEIGGKLGTIKGVPMNYKERVDLDDTVSVPVHSCYHSEELFRVPLNFENKEKEFFERQNIFIMLGENLL